MVQVIGKKEIIHSLRTKDALEAKRRCKDLSVKISNWFDSLLAGNPTEAPVLHFKPMPVQNTPEALAPAADASMSLSALLEAWATDRGLNSQEAKAQDATYVETERVVRHYGNKFGRAAIATINRDTVTELKRLYQRQKLTPITINKYLGRIRALLNFAHNQGFLPAHNIPSGVFTVTVRREDESNRRPFALEELQTLFRSPYFTGYKSSSKKHEAGDLITRDAFYWCPLIALFTGMRLEEIAQLAADNVKCEGDVWYIDVSDAKPYQRLKNAGSKRKVPLHYELKNLGFLKYHAQIKEANEERLFPELEQSADGRFSKELSKSFGRYRKNIGLTDKSIVFHSFRHTFKDACREAGIERDVHDKLTGHADSSVSASYGSGFSLARLNEEMQKIRYAGDLSHLYNADEVVRSKN